MAPRALSGWLETPESSYLVAYDQSLPVRTPCQGKGISEVFNLVDCFLRPHIPEFDNAITADATELGIFRRIKGNLFYRCRMTFELGRII